MARITGQVVIGRAPNDVGNTGPLACRRGPLTWPRLPGKGPWSRC